MERTHHSKVIRRSNPSTCDSAHEVTTYFDTPDADLAREGLSLRVRRRGMRHVQTLKLGGGHNGAFARNEWEWPVRTESPDLDLLAGTPAAALLSEALHASTGIRHRCAAYVRTVRRDGATIEVAVDRGRVDAGDASEEIREMELELKDGDPDPMYRLAAALHTNVPMTLGAESKADRGWRLRTGRPRKAAKHGDVELPKDVTDRGRVPPHRRIPCWRISWQTSLLPPRATPRACIRCASRSAACVRP